VGLAELVYWAMHQKQAKVVVVAGLSVLSHACAGADHLTTVTDQDQHWHFHPAY